MRYKLKFLPTALKEWKKLDNSIQAQFRKKTERAFGSDFVSFHFEIGFDPGLDRQPDGIHNLF